MPARESRAPAAHLLETWRARGLVAQGLPSWAAIPLALAFAALIMALVAWIMQRWVLGPLVNQNDLTLFMATIGAAFVMTLPTTVRA